MLQFTLILCFITIFIISKLVLSIYYKKNLVVNMRLDSVGKDSSNKADTELNQPLTIRFLKPLIDDFGKIVLKITPKELVKVYEKKVIMAGNPFNLSVKDWMNILVVLTVGLPIVTIFILYNFGVGIGQILFFAGAEVCTGIIIPSMTLNSNIKKRQKQMINGLPDVLDLLTVSVEAGLGFDGALAKVIDKMPGALSSEFAHVLQEVKVGKQKKEALRDMSNRIGVQDITTFIGSIIQAEQLGVSIGNVLRIQSEQLRQKRRQRAQEKAMKAPVKMLIPMVLFIFPTIFSVIIGPVIINMIKTFAK